MDIQGTPGWYKPWYNRWMRRGGRAVARMSNEAPVTLHAWICPGTPPGATTAVMAQLAELYEFGLIGPGSRVWYNADLPNAMWLLSDRSTFLRIVDVPAAGWVYVNADGAYWDRRQESVQDTRRAGRPGLCLEAMPIPVQEHDQVTVAFRNFDPRGMRAKIGRDSLEFEDYEATYRRLRVVDFKIEGVGRKAPLAAPTEFDTSQASIRGLDLMAATTGPAMHKVIRENLAAFTTTIEPIDFAEYDVMRDRAIRYSERFTDPIQARIAGLDGVGPFALDAVD